MYTIFNVDEMAISQFKATCLSVLERVRKTRTPLLITRHGVPVAQIVPPPPVDTPKTWLGSLAGSLTITGDIVSPVMSESDWEAGR
ncbi:MAG: type II toxin-antitoxin system Phd/YefM family antitoxin [Acidobacteria bacterium]|jgi:prevent-host-death family protein|nr:type II toxin-antitoxin system Phd/YefM family antitoxin [Acidobacteriota bacterium]